MASYILKEDGFKILIEDGSGSLLLEIQDFIIADSASSSSTENIVLVQASGIFEIADSSAGSSADNIEIALGGGLLAIADCVSDSSADNIAFQFVEVFTIDNIDSASSIENIVLVQSGGELQVSDIVSQSSAQNITLDDTGFTDAQKNYIDRRIIMWIEALTLFLICILPNAPPY